MDNDLGQIYCLQGQLPQPLSSVNIGLIRPCYTTTAKLGADTILASVRMMKLEESYKSSIPGNL